MTTDRYHKAAKDGLLDALKDVTRKDANAKDEDSMTPTLWAAFEGRLNALRLLCGRGGDPDKYDQFGNTALHLASAKGHIHCVDFLVKFGVNIYTLDIDRHSAKDLAAINNQDEILRYLDAAAASFEAKDKKKAKTLKEQAEKNCEKRMREYMKRQQKLENEYENMRPAPLAVNKSNNMLSSLKQKIWSSQGNLHKTGTTNSTKYSDLVAASSGSSSGSIISRATVQRKGLNINKSSNDENATDGGFKIGTDIEADGKRTITSLTGLQRDSEVLYVGSFNNNDDKRGKISDVFEVDEMNSDNERETYKHGTLSRSYSQPDILGDSNPADTRNEQFLLQRPAGIFDKPMLGSITFRRSVTAALSQLNSDTYSVDMASNSTNSTTRCGTSANAGAKCRTGKPRSFFNISDSDSDGVDAYSDDEQDASGSPIQRFLTVWGLEEYLTVFQKQQIDLDTLMLLTESDLKSLGLPLGPFRKLTFAIQERRSALANPGIILDSAL